MAYSSETGPSEQIDIDFREGIIPPARTFADTMRLHWGWSRPSRDTLDRAPYLADTDNVDMHVEAMQRFAADTYGHFGGGEGKLPFGASFEQTLDYVSDPENQDRFMVHGFEEEIASLAFRYLNGEGDDYAYFHNVQQMI